jgi:hypothetical protein
LTEEESAWVEEMNKDDEIEDEPQALWEREKDKKIFKENNQNKKKKG